MWFTKSDKLAIVDAGKALPGRETSVVVSDKHCVLGRSVHDVPEGFISIQFGMGCFWGAERRFWQQSHVYSTAAGYAGGYTHNPSYEEVCSGLTGHTEVVNVVYQNNIDTLLHLLAVFWESHDPTQGMRQGNDIGTQYRSCIYVNSEEQLAVIKNSAEAYQLRLADKGFGEITTELDIGKTFYFAEDYHQQYLAKNPNGYCGLRGTGVNCV